MAKSEGTPAPRLLEKDSGKLHMQAHMQASCHACKQASSHASRDARAASTGHAPHAKHQPHPLSCVPLPMSANGNGSNWCAVPGHTKRTPIQLPTYNPHATLDPIRHPNPPLTSPPRTSQQRAQVAQRPQAWQLLPQQPLRGARAARPHGALQQPRPEPLLCAAPRSLSPPPGSVV